MKWYPYRAVYRLLSYLALAVALCAATASCVSYQSELKAALVTTDAAAKSFEVYDQQHQASILTTSTTFDEWKATITEYRRKQQAVLDSLVLVYQAIATAALNPSDVTVKVVTDDLADLKAVLHDLGVDVPGASAPSTPATPTTPTS